MFKLGNHNFDPHVAHSDKSSTKHDLNLMPSFVDLHQALRARNQHSVEQVLSTGVDVNTAYRGTTPLSVAVYTGSEDAAELLLTHGANVNQLSRDHLDRLEPPLYTACRLGMASIVRILIAHHADINKPDWYGQTPLWAAVRERRLDLVQLLLDSGARLAEVRTWSACPLFLATKYLHFGRRDIAVLLTRSGCDPNLIDSNNRTTLYWALKHGDKELAILLMMAGARSSINWDCRQLGNDLSQDVNFCAWFNRERNSASPLKRLCRLVIRRHLVSLHSGSVCNWIDKLPLPIAMKCYLNLDPP